MSAATASMLPHVLDAVDGELAHRDDAQHAAGLVVEEADRVTAGVGDDDVPDQVVRAGACAQSGDGPTILRTMHERQRAGGSLSDLRRDTRSAAV
jgi:hypothetical protein